MKSNRRIVAAFTMAFALVLCHAAAACTPAEDKESGEAGDQQAVSQEVEFNLEEAIANAQPGDPFVADEVCLSCHGGTYEAIAQLTDHYGDSNPHGGTHGVGGMTCGQCHVDGQTVPTAEDNMCLDCHAWPREDESYIEYMDL